MVTVECMDESAMSPQALPYTESDVTALLDFEGGLLYLYFSLMLGDEVSATRALGDTIIAALPDTNYLRLFTIARTVRRQYRSAPAAPDARPAVPSLTGVAIAALLRLDPDDREICVLGAPRYRLNDRDLANILRTRMVAPLRRQASGRFDWEVEACASGAGLEVSQDLPVRALRTLGSEPVALPYDQIVPLATDPVLEGLREGIRARVALPTEAAPPAERPLQALGNRRRMAIAAGPLSSMSSRAAAAWPHLTVTESEFQEAEDATVPLRPVPARRHSRQANARRRAVAATVVAAGAIPAAIAGVALVGHSVHHRGQDSASSPLLGVPGAPAPHAASAPAGKHYTPRHAKPPVQGAQGGAAGGGSVYDANMSAMGSGTASSGSTASTSTASTASTSTASTKPAASHVTTSNGNGKGYTGTGTGTRTTNGNTGTNTGTGNTGTGTGTNNGNGNGNTDTGTGTGTNNGNGNGNTGNGPKMTPPGQIKNQGQGQGQVLGLGQNPNQTSS